MILFKVLIFLLIQTQINVILVSVGNYRHYRKYGINLPNCGHRYRSTQHNVRRSSKCFNSSPGNTSVDIFPQSMNDNINQVDQVSTRIYKAKVALIDESPWSVRLGITYMDHNATTRATMKDLRNCTGSLITFEWVLTAAHCFAYRFVLKVEVFVGSRLEEDFVDQRYIIIHPDHLANTHYVNTVSGYDIALVKLGKRLDPDLKDDIYYRINTICLPNEDFPKQLERSYFSGRWEDKLLPPGILQITKFVLVMCRNRTQPNSFGNAMICHLPLDTQPKPCIADSGGPLFQFGDETPPRAFQIGVLRSGLGPKCKRGDTESQWVPPMSFIPWILETIANNTLI